VTPRSAVRVGLLRGRRGFAAALHDVAERTDDRMSQALSRSAPREREGESRTLRFSPFRSFHSYQTDALGSVTGLVNSANQLVNRYQYTPWGELVTEESTYTTYDPLGFTARERDDETRLYYYRARYYDPQLGRFISEDPIGLAGGPNVYAYVGNNPVNATDPFGLCEKVMVWRDTDGDGKLERVVECKGGGALPIEGVTGVGIPSPLPPSPLPPAPVPRGPIAPMAPPTGDPGTPAAPAPNPESGEPKQTPWIDCMGNANKRAYAAATTIATGAVTLVGAVAREGATHHSRMAAGLALEAVKQNNSFAVYLRAAGHGNKALMYGKVAFYAGRVGMFGGGLILGYNLGAAGMCLADGDTYN